MAESIVKVPSVEALGLDFLAFSFNGKHSWDDFHIYRVINGDRYEENLSPALTDKTAEVPGGDGMYYFGTTHKQKEFNISFAFDHLTETELKELKEWLNGKEIGDLWFSEAPYKIWSAKPTGNSSIKYIPFDDLDKQGNAIRIYKGEGSVQFTAYWPYAHTPDYVGEGDEFFSLTANNKINFTEPVTTKYFYIESKNYVEILFYTDELGGYPQMVAAGESILKFNASLTFLGIKANQNCDIRLWATTAATIGGFNNDINKKPLYPTKQTEKKNGKILGAYEAFPNKNEWAAASGLVNDFEAGDNPGQLPSVFVFSKTGVIAKNTSPSATFVVGDLSITIPAESITTTGSTTTYTHYKNLTWDSKTGIVSAYKNANSIGVDKPIAIPYTGNSLGAIPTGGISNWGMRTITGSNISYSTEDCTLKYHYWYY